MGLTQVTVAITNPSNAEKRWEGTFLVDTGAIDCLVPVSVLEAIGLEPVSSRVYELADGQQLEFPIAGAQFEFMGDTVWTTVIFGPENAEPILGVTALESAGIMVDPRNQRLKRLPAVPLK